jgi:hypothetical protein
MIQRRRNQKQREIENTRAETRLGLAEAASGRADTVLAENQQTRQDARDRVVKQDRAKELQAKFQRDPDSLSEAEDIERLELAPFDANIATSEKNRRVQAETAGAAGDVLGFVADQTRSLSNVAQEGQTPGVSGPVANSADAQLQSTLQGPAPVDGGSAAGVDPVTAVRPPDFGGPAAAPGADAGVTDPGQGTTAGQFIGVKRSTLQETFPDQDISSLPSPVSPAESANPNVLPGGVGATVEIPVAIQQEIEALDELDGVPYTLAKREIQAKLFDSDAQATNAAAVQAQKDKEVTAATYDATIDKSNPDGEAMRSLAVDNPAAFVNEAHRNWSKMTPATQDAFMDQYSDVIEQQARTGADQMRAISPGPDGSIDTSTREYQRAQRNLNNSLRLLEDNYGNWNKKRSAAIRRGGIPVGQSPITDEIIGSMADAPRKAIPDSRQTMNAKQTVLRKTYDSIQGGNRNITATQVDSMAHAVATGVLTLQEAADMISGKAFAPTSKGFKAVSHDGEKDLILLNQDTGQYERIVKGTGPAPDVPDQFGDAQDYLNSQYEPRPGMSDEKSAELAREYDQLKVNMLDPEAQRIILGATGLSMADISKWDQQGLNWLVARNRQFINEVPTLYDEEMTAWWSRNEQYKDLPAQEKANIGNYQQYLAERDIEISPIPFPTKPGVNAGEQRASINATGTTDEQWAASLMTDPELEAATSAAIDRAAGQQLADSAPGVTR